MCHFFMLEMHRKIKVKSAMHMDCTSHVLAQAGRGQRDKEQFLGCVKAMKTLVLSYREKFSYFSRVLNLFQRTTHQITISYTVMMIVRLSQ